MKSLNELVPVFVDRWVRFLAWASLAAQILIVGTGGAVRLTGSGLGCPSWPQCTAESLVATPELGIHGAIEFGNRLMTFVLIIIALAMFLAVLRQRSARPDLFALSLVQGLSIPAQAVLGGITVLTGLNSYIVGAHFLVSIALVVVTTILVYRVYYGRRGTERVGPLWLMITAHLTSLLVAVTVIVGVLTTGSGPHAGDVATPRNGLDPELLQHFHSWPAYATLAGTIVILLGGLRLGDRRLIRFGVLLLGIEFAQVAVGLAQASLGLPELLVGIHMVLACCLVSAMTAVVLSLRARS